jgi:hypothetical protein
VNGKRRRLRCGSNGDRWGRFHSLPGSKRYAESEVEYAIVLDRYNTILDEPSPAATYRY